MDNTIFKGCTCQSCGLEYYGDLVIPNAVWEKIRGVCNLLCPTCIMNRIIEQKIWTAAYAVDIDSEQAEDAYS